MDCCNCLSLVFNDPMISLILAFHHKIPLGDCIKLVEWHKKLLKLVYKCPYFNAQTDFQSREYLLFYIKKNKIQVPSISRVKIYQFKEQAVDCVLSMQTTWFQSNNNGIDYGPFKNDVIKKAAIFAPSVIYRHHGPNPPPSKKMTSSRPDLPSVLSTLSVLVIPSKSTVPQKLEVSSRWCICFLIYQR